jgi:hypothetical protein
MGRPSSGRPASAGVWVGLYRVVNPPAISSTFGQPGWKQFSIAAFSPRGKVMVVRVLYALGRPLVPGWGPHLRRAGTWVRIFLADGLRVRDSLLVGLCFIRCLINTKANFAISIDRDIVMHHKI